MNLQNMVIILIIFNFTIVEFEENSLPPLMHEMVKCRTYRYERLVCIIFSSEKIHRRRRVTRQRHGKQSKLISVLTTTEVQNRGTCV